MKEKNFTLHSSVDGLQLDCLEVLPEGKVKGIVQFSHGMVEYKERYLDFMRFLARHGYACIIHDHRGHGKSVKSKEDWGYFYDASGTAIVEDLQTVAAAIRFEFPHVPIALFGHSMGSLVARCFLKKYDGQIDKLIVCGAPGQNPLGGVAAGLVDVLTLVKHDRHRSALLANLSTGSYDKKFEGDLPNRWISANPENVKAYNSEPASSFVFTLNGFKNLFALLRNTYDPKGWVLENREIPILFIAGADDPVILSKKKWEQAQDFLRNLGYQHVSGILYPGMRHEILQEKEKRQVYDDVLAFLDA